MNNLETSASINKIAPALLKAQQTMGAATKSSDNPYFNSKYADLNAIRAVAIPALNAVGISVLQPHVVIEGKQYVRTLLLHESGEFLSSDTEVIADKNTAQAHASGISYSRRYGLQSFVNIGAEDDDGEAAVGRKANYSKAATKTAPVKTEAPITQTTNAGKAEASKPVVVYNQTSAVMGTPAKTSSFRKPGKPAAAPVVDTASDWE